jgi:hypothetical protein
VHVSKKNHDPKPCVQNRRTSPIVIFKRVVPQTQSRDVVALDPLVHNAIEGDRDVIDGEDILRLALIHYANITSLFPNSVRHGNKEHENSKHNDCDTGKNQAIGFVLEYFNDIIGGLNVGEFIEHLVNRFVKQRPDCP